MRSALFCLTFTFYFGLAATASAQKAYKVVYKLDGAQSGWGYLFATATQTYYYRLKNNELPIENPAIEKVMGVDAPQPTMIKDATKAQNSRVLYYKEAKKPLIYVENITDNYFSVSDNLTIDWRVLSNQTKKIGTYTCQKALAQVRGREYEVWFTSEVAVSGGPWKLHNLPGLILEATSTDQKYRFLFDRIETVEPSMANLNYVFREPVLPYEQFLVEAEKYNQTKTNELQKKTQSGWSSVFSGAKTGGMTLKTNNIEKNLEKTYTANTAK